MLYSSVKGLLARRLTLAALTTASRASLHAGHQPLHQHTRARAPELGGAHLQPAAWALAARYAAFSRSAASISSRMAWGGEAWWRFGVGGGQSKQAIERGAHGEKAV